MTATHKASRHGREDDAEVAVEEDALAFGKLSRPAYLQGEAAAAWDKWVAPAGFAAVALCELWAEHRKDPVAFNAARHGQLRAYAAELGLTDERVRARVTKDKLRSRFFDDLDD